MPRLSAVGISGLQAGEDVRILMGPVLYFRGVTAGRCHLAALVVTPLTQTPPALRLDDGGETLPEALTSRLGKTAWRYAFSIPANREGVSSEYAIGEQRWRVHPPAGGRLRLAYSACNGSESDPLGKSNPDHCERWRHLAAQHVQTPFQLLIQGGDQLYADEVWNSVPELAAWRKLGRRARLHVELPPEAATAAADFYFDHYCRLWSKPDIAPLLASIPSLMMWDDHDIFDGWGSHSPAKQLSPAFQAIWTAARENFALFQLGARPETLPAGFGDPNGGHFGWAFKVGEVGIVAPDLRSRRTRTSVIGEAGWRWLSETLESMADCRQLLFVSTVPVINIDLSWLERLLVLMPEHHGLYTDDLRDQWRSYAHRAEWLRLLTRLLDFSECSSRPVTVLSGEIHLGALGRVQRHSASVVQLTSSGIVHPPPPKPLVRAFDWLGRRTQTIAPAITLSMLPLPALDSRYLAARAWLSLEIDPGRSIQAQWHAEGNPGEMILNI